VLHAAVLRRLGIITGPKRLTTAELAGGAQALATDRQSSVLAKAHGDLLRWWLPVGGASATRLLAAASLRCPPALLQGRFLL